MKRKAGKELKKSKNPSPEKIKEITRKIRLADLGIQNAARLKQEKEEKNAYERILEQSKGILFLCKEDFPSQKSNWSIYQGWKDNIRRSSNNIEQTLLLCLQ